MVRPGRPVDEEVGKNAHCRPLRLVVVVHDIPEGGQERQQCDRILPTEHAERWSVRLDLVLHLVHVVKLRLLGNRGSVGETVVPIIHDRLEGS